MTESSQPTPEAPDFLELPEIPTAVVRRRGFPISRLNDLMDVGFTTLGQAIEAGKFVPAGPPFARYDTELNGEVDFSSDYPLDLEVGFPLNEALTGPIETDAEQIIPSSLPAGPIARAVHTGPYEELASAWQVFTESVAAAGYEMALPFWEAYHDMPTPETDPNTLETGLAIVVRRP